MNRKIGIWAAAALVVAAAAAGVIAFVLLAQPRTPQAQLEQARELEARASVRLARLKASTSPEDVSEAAQVRGEVAAGYAAVRARFPEARPHIEQAEYALLQFEDRQATSPEERLRLITRFLDEHASSSHAADLRWKGAEITDRDLKRPLDAIEVYEEFARDFPKDPRAPEALFRVGGVYEKIREYPQAVDAYRRVVRDYPESLSAEQAQFRIGTLLADKLEKKAEAEKEFARVEEKYPKSRLAGAAAGERRRLAAATKTSEAEQARDEYYGGVREFDLTERLRARAELPQMQQIRAQATDLLHQRVQAVLSPAEGLLTATTHLEIVSRAPGPGTTGSLLFQLGSAADVLEVTRGEQPLPFQAEDGWLEVELKGRPLASGTTESFRVTYTVRNPENWAGEITSGATHLVNETWIPLMDLGDGFTGEFRIQAPTGYRVATQGMRGEPEAQEGEVVWTFRQNEPAYYHALVAAPYLQKEEIYKSAASGREIPLSVLLFTETSASLAGKYLDDLRRILSFYEEKLGPYPYPGLTVAQVQSFPGGLGTPGLILVGPPGFENPEAPAQFLAHEVAHAWFGNLLGLNLGPGSIPWLSEGFAQYWDALYHEHRHGERALARLMRSRAETYYAALSRVTDQPLNNARFSDPIYAPLTYEKGAFVLHALRSVVGDNAFFAAMRDYVGMHRGRIVTVSDFQEVVEQAAGEPMGWFFDQWLNRPGFPRYRIVSARETRPGAGGAPYEATVVVEQVGAVFTMPVEFEVESAEGSPLRQRVTIDDPVTTFTITTTSEPLKVVLDPDYRILKHPRREETEKAVTR